MMKYLKKIILLIVFAIALLSITSLGSAQVLTFQFVSAGGDTIDFGNIDENSNSASRQGNLQVFDAGAPYRIEAEANMSFLGNGGNRIDATGMFLTLRGIISGTSDFEIKDNLSSLPRTIFESDGTGTGEVLTLELEVTVPDDIFADNYEGEIELSFYLNEQLVDSQRIRLTFSVEPVIEITVVEPETRTPITLIDFKDLVLPMETATSEIKLSVSTNLGKRFRIEQEMNDPFINDRNQERISYPEFLSYQVQKESSRGQLYTSDKELFQYEKQTLYVSSEDGREDTLNIYYFLSNVPDLVYGVYSSVLQFKVVPYDAANLFEEQSLDVLVSFRVEKMLFVKTTPIDKEKWISMGAMGKEQKELNRAYHVEVTSNVGERYVVKQDFLQPVINQEGREFQKELVLLKADGGKNGEVLVKGFTPVIYEEMLLFESDEKGSSDSFDVFYKIKNASSAIGGRYSSTIRIFVEQIH